MVLVRPSVRRVEQERLAFSLARAEPLEVDPEVDHSHPLRRDAEPLHDRLLYVLADREHEPALSDCGPVRDPPVGALRTREELWEDLVLEVED